MPLTSDERVALSREDDRRMSALESSSALIAHQQTTLAASVGEVKAIVNALDAKFDAMLERLIHEHAEAEATPAGRALLKTTDANHTSIDRLSTRVDELEQWRDEFRGSMATLRSVTYIASALSAAAMIVSALHTVGLV